jgi:PAS domain S-box-containing protein
MRWERTVTAIEEIARASPVHPSVASGEGRFARLAEDAPDIVYLYRVEPDPGFAYVSPSSARITGRSPDEHYADPDLLIHVAHPHDQDLAAAMLRTPTAFPEPVMVRLIHTNGEIVWTNHRIEPIVDATSKVVAVEGVARDVTERVTAENELWRTVMTLRRSEEERRRLLHLLVQAEERERARLSADLRHDAIQVLTAAAARLVVLRRTPLVDWARDEVGGIQAAIQEAAGRLRSLTAELSPMPIERKGLVAALQESVDRLAGETGMDCVVDARIEEEPDSDARVELHRLALEALANVRKHAVARRVRVLLDQRDVGYLLRVEDDGTGFDRDRLENLPYHVGLRAMRERAEILGGRCEIRSSPGAGTTVDVWVPNRVP